MPVPEADMTANAGAPDPMGADPELGAGIGNMAEDPNAGMPTEDPGMEGDDMGTEDGEDSTVDIINKHMQKVYWRQMKTSQAMKWLEQKNQQPHQPQTKVDRVL